jgi:hypothetical protein
MKRLMLLRSVSLALAVILATAAVLDWTAQFTRPPVRAEVVFLDGARLPLDFTTTAASVSLDGDTRADVAALAAQRVLLAPVTAFDRAGGNRVAQDATMAALRVSPVNSLMWLSLGLLKAQQSEPAGPALKVSYLTGALRRDALLQRVRTVVTSDAVNDEEVRLLAQSDIRTILTKYSQLEPALAAAYRQAGANGKAFVLDATAMVDPGFSKILLQYP